MNIRERFIAIMNFEKPDRNLHWEMGYWTETLENWYRQGLPRKYGIPDAHISGQGVRAEANPFNDFSKDRFRDKDVHEHLSMDKALVSLPINSGPYPPFEPIVFEETDVYMVFQDALGVKKRIKKKGTSAPQFIGWQVEKPKATMFVWAQIPEQYREMGSLEFSKKLLNIYMLYSQRSVSGLCSMQMRRYGISMNRWGMLFKELLS